MKQKYLLLSMALFVFLLFSTTSLALIPGDFGSANNGPPDGVVDFEDLMIFALAYSSTPSDANWNPACDIAGQGSTTSDGVIDFEDLMIFAMNYGRSDKIHNLTKDTYYNTIQAALDDADTDNIIEVADGTYNESITFPTDKLVTLQSASGIRDNVIIQGVNILPTVTINGSSTGTTLRGFTITHTGGDTGGGIYKISGNLIIDNCIISGNAAGSGGGIDNDGGTIDITGSTISGNAAGSGGGIDNDGGTIDITGSTISGNTAGNGGGIYNDGGTIDITGSTISGNTTTGNGGGIYNKGTLTITSSDISGNTATWYGGGINNKGTLTITGSTISGNTTFSGGGINNKGTLTITSSDISGNTAGWGGGINNKGTLTITSNSTIFSNTATVKGGGIDNNGTLTITSSDISGNTTTGNGGGIDNGGTLTITSSDISGNTATNNTGTNHGGGICNYGGTLTITGSTISDNTATRGGGIFNLEAIEGTLTITGSTISGNNVSKQGGGIFLDVTGTNTIGGNDASDTSNFNTFTDNKKDGIISAYQHICVFGGDCRSSYPYNYYDPTKWTIMVYMDGDNNLDDCAWDDLTELESVSSTDEIKIVAQLDAFNSCSGTFRYYITGAAQGVSYPLYPDDIVQTLSEQNMADPATLTSFVNWATTNYPAEKYLLVIWNHGGGWKEKNILTKGVIWDDTSGDFMTMAELVQGLIGVNEYIDIIGFDACLMQMSEVACEIGVGLTNSPNYMIGSQELEWGDGWPYDDILNHLTTNPAMDEATLCETIVNDYINYCGTPATLSALYFSPGAINNSLNIINSFANALMNSSYQSEIAIARSSAQSYMDHPEYKDLYDFAQIIYNSVPDCQTQAQAVMDLINTMVITEAHVGNEVENSHGLSIFLPDIPSGYDEDYDLLRFALDTQWDEFLQSEEGVVTGIWAYALASTGRIKTMD